MPWLILTILVLIGLAVTAKPITIAVGEFFTGSKLPDWEEKIILSTARMFGVDPRFLATIRRQEAGGPGREFGVLSVDAPTYEEQATVAARTLRRVMERYQRDTGLSAVDPQGDLTHAFVVYFVTGGPSYPGWVGADDPQGRKNWLENAPVIYAQISTTTVV